MNSSLRAADGGGFRFQDGGLESVWVAVAPVEANLHQDTAMFLVRMLSAQEQPGPAADEEAVCVGNEVEVSGRRAVRVVIRPATLKVNFRHVGTPTESVEQLGGVETWEGVIGLLMYLYGDRLPPLSLPKVQLQLDAGDLGPAEVVSGYANACQVQLQLDAGDLGPAEVVSGYANACQGLLKRQLTSASAAALPGMRNAVAVAQALAGLVVEPLRDKHRLRGVTRGSAACCRAILLNVLDATASLLAPMHAILERAEGVLVGPEERRAGGGVQDGGVSSSSAQYSLSQAFSRSCTQVQTGLQTAYASMGGEAAQGIEPHDAPDRSHGEATKGDTCSMFNFIE
ncbi:hypothetical protein T484DRAFT_1793865 [Baffinella frigidus]|nr:hypothetical protein T484DRAFT_1793865 [Cryptophyta sp. CCMP2293]